MSKPQRPPAQITKKESKRKGRGFRRILTDRNHLIIGVFELFFRKNMGVRYFDKGTFIAILIGLLGMKFLLSFSLILRWFDGILGGFAMAEFMMPFPYPFCAFDAFILLCIPVGIYHLREQKRLRAEGIRINTDGMGYSRFAGLGKYLDSEYPQLAAYVYIEPLAAFALSFWALSHSFILGVMGMIGAGRLWYENYLVVREYKDMIYNIEDSQIMSDYMEGKREQNEREIKAAKAKAARAATPPPIPKRAPIVVPPPIPLVSNPEDEISAIDAIRQIKKEQKGEI